MMTLKYVGPKPLISVTGVEFDHNKEDKFVYLSIVAELIQALDHEYAKDQRYTCVTGQRPLTPDMILSLLRSRDSDLAQEISDREAIATAEINSEIEHAHHNRLLNEEEREVLIKNIELLRSYRIQRAINKTVYYSGITSLAHIIQKGDIDYIAAPMYAIFVHVFHSIEGALQKLRPPIDSRIDIYEENGHLNVQLKLKHI